MRLRQGMIAGTLGGIGTSTLEQEAGDSGNGHATRFPARSRIRGDRTGRGDYGLRFHAKPSCGSHGGRRGAAGHRATQVQLRLHPHRRRLRGLPGVFSHASEHHDRPLPRAAARDGLDPRPRAAFRQAADSRLDKAPAACGRDDRRGPEARRLRHGEHRQVAPGEAGILARAPGLRRELRRDGPGPAAKLLRPLQDPDDPVGAQRRVPDRPPRRRGRQVHRRPQGPPVLPLPAALRRAYAADGQERHDRQVPGEGEAREPAAQRHVRGDDRER